LHNRNDPIHINGGQFDKTFKTGLRNTSVFWENHSFTEVSLNIFFF